MFEAIFKGIKIRYNKSYLYDLILNDPNSNNFLGIISILNNYKIENSVAHLNHPNDVFEQSLPFVLHLKNQDEILTVYEKSDKIIKAINDKGKKVAYRISDLTERWSGKVIRILGENGKEKEYLKNFIYEVGVKVVIGMFFIGILISNFYNNSNVLFNFFFLIINLIGLVVSYQLYKLSKEKDNKGKICNFSEKTDCLDVISHKNSKFIGMISYDKIGVAFFLFFLSFRIFLDIETITFPLAIIISLSALFPIYSIYFQYFVVRKWCPLCLIVQVCVLLNFTLFFYQFKKFDIDFLNSFKFLFHLLLISSFVLLFSLYDESRDKKNFFVRRFHLFLKNDAIINSLLSKGIQFTSMPAEYKIIQGNINAEYKLTIITNPFCKYCLNKYKELKKVSIYNPDIAIETIFLIAKEHERINKIAMSMVQIYLRKGSEIYNNALDDWYEFGINDISKWERKYVVSGYIFEQEKWIVDAHREWAAKSKINATATILINDTLLPQEYEIGDFSFL